MFIIFLNAPRPLQGSVNVQSFYCQATGTGIVDGDEIVLSSPGTGGTLYFTVPVEATYQVWRVTRVLSMGKVGTHVQGVPEKSCQIKPWKNFEKMQF